jgi:thiamine biosynthesis lipoprotein
MHHLIDPSTGAPAAEHWRTVSVAAGSCVDANIASCAAILLGAAAPGWLRTRGLPARLVAPGGRVTTVAGWPEEPDLTTAGAPGAPAAEATASGGKW